ncbi:hypothetical protein BC567DRAFT_225932 [Phyllosticta citribraziliensis]
MMPLLPTFPTAKRPPARLEGRESSVRREWGMEGWRVRWLWISFWRRWKESCLLWCLRASDWSLCFAPMGLCAGAGILGDDEWTGQRELSWADTTMVMVIHDAEGGMVLMLRHSDG